MPSFSLGMENESIYASTWPCSPPPPTPPSPGATEEEWVYDNDSTLAVLGTAAELGDGDDDEVTIKIKDAESDDSSSPPLAAVRPGKLSDMPKELFGSSFKVIRSSKQSGSAPPVNYEPPARVSSTALQEGSCFKASRVSCYRDIYSIRVKAAEIHVVDPMDEPNIGIESPEEQDLGWSKKTRRPHKTQQQPSIEKRKVIHVTTLVVDTPSSYLRPHETENGTTVIELAEGTLPARRFPAMVFREGVGYSETKAAAVLLGLDIAGGYHWMTPMALRHVKRVWQSVQDAGGVFVVDFDISESGWAKFRTAYVCPAPSKTVQYVHICKLKARACFGGNVARPLAVEGGKFFTRGFAPARTDLDDPEVFRDIRRSLLLSPDSMDT